MLGFAGLLSIGHALFIGVGAYAAAALFVHFGIPPAIGIFAAIAVAVAAGCFIGALGFRFEIRGVYFALLTIAFAEFVRIMIDHWSWLGGTAGLFLPVSNREGIDLLNLRGSPLMFYYIILALNFGALALCRWLLAGRLGFYWQAIRDDQDAAQALGINVFRYKMIAVAISSGMAGIAGVFYAFFYNNLFPEQIFAVEQSVQLTFAPIVGGVGTLFGPILGAFILTPLGRVLATRDRGLEPARHPASVLGHLRRRHRAVPAGRHLAVAGAQSAPDRQAGKGRVMAKPLLVVDGISKSFRGLRAVANVSFSVDEGGIVGLIGPNGAGKTTCFNMIAGVFRAGQRPDPPRRQDLDRAPAGPDLPRRRRAHLPAGQAVQGPHRRGERRRRRAVRLCHGQ